MLMIIILRKINLQFVKDLPAGVPPRHDENYMQPKVIDAHEKTGRVETKQ